MTEALITLGVVPARVIPVPATTAAVQIDTRGVVLLGWAWVEQTGTAGAAFTLYNGAVAGGIIVAPITLTAGESTRDALGPVGLWCDGGVTLNMESGQVRGSLWVADL